MCNELKTTAQRRLKLCNYFGSFLSNSGADVHVFDVITASWVKKRQVHENIAYKTIITRMATQIM